MLRVNTLSGFGRRQVTGGDADAQAYIDALLGVGVNDSTINTAWSNFVTAAKAGSFWTDLVACYPFAGGSAGAHAINAKNPGTYNITWSGTVTHNTNGITPNGSTGYGDTGLQADSLTANNTHLALYGRSVGDVGAESMHEFGCDDGTNRFALSARYFNATRFAAYSMTTQNAGYLAVTSVSSAQGFFLGSRRSGTDFELYKNGTSLFTGAAGEGSLPARNIYIGALNTSGTAGSFINRNLAWASIGAGLTDAKVTAYNTAVEAFQDALSRGVV